MSPLPRSVERIYFRNLDALRFLSFLSVFFFHSFYTTRKDVQGEGVYHFFKFTLFGNGNLGVNFFFVLSGFLITFLLISEKEKFGDIAVVSFWKRRILRIWPLFYFCVLCGFFLSPLIKMWIGEQVHETNHLLAYIFFVSNFDMIRNGLPDSALLSVLWSISIEEQFYLVWPLLLLLPSRYECGLFIMIIALSLGFRAYYSNETYNELHTLSCMGDMAVGALGAWGVIRKKLDVWFSDLPRYWITLLYAMLVPVFLFRHEMIASGFFIHVFERFGIAMIFLAVILEQSFARHSLFKAGSIAVLTDLGKISYGLYCLHFFAILAVTKLFRFGGIDNLWSVLLWEPVTSLVLAVVLAKLSYKYFESPFLAQKERLVRI